jgi:hypothetical protein
MSGKAVSRRWPLAVPLAALTLAVAGARPFAGGWNDGSRLATVESLVDRHTFVIDDSIFVHRPGTQDKVLINGRFYSDKPPVSSMLLAAVYQALQWTTGLTARDDPQRFCWWMNLAGAGVPYVVAVAAIAGIAALLGLPPSLQALLSGSFAFATVAPAYARHVNGHIELLAVVALAYLQLLRGRDHPTNTGGPVVIGALIGLGYTLDLAAGPLFMLLTVILIAGRGRSGKAVAVCLGAAAPAVLLHHGVTYAIAGTLLPPNTVTEYLAWPGSPFTPETMTGRLHHRPLDLASYALALLFDGRGFLVHNLPLLLPGLAAVWVVPRARGPERALALHAIAWMAATWLAYALTSTNHSGACLSIRWFVPFLAPAFLLIAVLIRDQPDQRGPLVLSSGWGILLAAAMWHAGPWTQRRIVVLWPIVIALGVSTALRQWKRAPS